MRIVIVANTIEELGGAQRVVHHLADGLAARGHAVTLVGITAFEPAHPYRHGPEVRTVTVQQGRDMDRAVRGLQALLDEGDPGVIICAQLWAMEHLARCRLDGWRVIGQYHSSYEAAAAGRDLPRAERVYRQVDAFALLTAGDARAFAAHGFENTVVMPNAVIERPDAPASLDQPIVTYLGRLAPEKGPRFLVDAWRIVDRTYPTWRLRIIGTGPSQPEIAASIDGLRIDLLPPTDDPVAALMDSSILALPSLTEGFPLSLAEAMACGLACVASDCSAGVRELITDGVSGIIAHRGDSVDLARHLDALMSDGDLRRRLGAGARAATVVLQPDAVLDRWEVLLAEVSR